MTSRSMMYLTVFQGLRCTSCSAAMTRSFCSHAADLGCDAISATRGLMRGGSDTAAPLLLGAPGGGGAAPLDACGRSPALLLAAVPGGGGTAAGVGMALACCSAAGAGLDGSRDALGEACTRG